MGGQYPHGRELGRLRRDAVARWAEETERGIGLAKTKSGEERVLADQLLATLRNR